MSTTTILDLGHQINGVSERPTLAGQHATASGAIVTIASGTRDSAALSEVRSRAKYRHPCDCSRRCCGPEGRVMASRRRRFRLVVQDDTQK
jgi:hypothetical protein